MFRTFSVSKVSANRLTPRTRFTFLFAAALISLTAATPAAAQGSQFAYVANLSSNNVTGYQLNPVTGALTPVPGSPFALANVNTNSVAIDQAGGFLYVSDGSVFGFRIEPITGRLISIPGSPFTGGSSTASVAVDPSGKFVFAANQGSNSVSAFRIEPVTGRLIAVSGSPFAAGSGPSSVTVDPSGQFVYLTNQYSNDVSGFTINAATGALTPIPGSPFAAGTFPQSVAVDPLDRYVYVANQGSDNISGFSINPATGALTPLLGGPFAAGAGGVLGVTVDPTGKYVYAAGFGGLYAYSIGFVNTCSPFPNCFSAGALTLIAGSPFGTGSNVAYGAWTPNSVAVDYNGAFTYATNGPYGAGNVEGFTGSGTLTQFPGAPFPSENGSFSIALTRPKTTPIYSATPIPDQVFQPLIGIAAAGIDNKGQVAGSAVEFAGNETLEFAFLYSMGTTGSGGGFGTHTTIAYGLNNRGQVVGTSATSVPVAPFLVLNEAYSFANGKTVNLDGRQGGQSSAFGINDAGQIAGSKSTGTCTSTFGGCQSGAGLGDTHAFLDTGSGLTDIGTLGGNFSEGRGINNSGEITGGSNLIANGPNHVFLYRRGAMHDLGFVGEGTAINDDSQIVGTGAQGGFLYRDGAFHLLPVLPGGTYTTPAGINNHGDVVGTADVLGPSGAPTHAFLYKGGKTLDLNTLVDSSLTLLTSAAGINDKSQIVAAGLNGQLYILTPKK